MKQARNAFGEFHERPEVKDVDDHALQHIAFMIVVDALFIRVGFLGLTDAGTNLFEAAFLGDTYPYLLPRAEVGNGVLQTPREFGHGHGRIQLVIGKIDKQTTIKYLGHHGIAHIAYGKFAIGFIEKLFVRHHDLCVLDRTHMHFQLLAQYTVGSV